MDALKSLAGDQSVTYGKKLDALPGELSDSGLNKDQVKAVTGLAKIVADAALKGYRQKQLQDLIGSANEDVQLITKALGEIITTAIDAIRTGQPSSSAPSLNPDARCRAASTFTKAFRRVTHD